MSRSVLLSSFSIHNTVFRNRIMLPSMVTHYASVDGGVTERLIAYHVARARGGVGLNMLESTAVSAAGRSFTPGLSLGNDSFIKGFNLLADAVHAQGGKIGVQIGHAGRLAKPEVSGHARQLVSLVPGLTAEEDSRVLDEDDIHEIIEAFAAAAGRAVEAGFDLVELHGAHGYLLSQFMSPLFNRRTDAYGGDFDDRMRVPLEMVRRVRQVVGPDFPLSFRCSVEEYLPGGITLPLGVRIASAVVDAGIDLFNVSVGLGETNRFTGPPPHLSKGWNAERAAAVKAELGARGAVAVAGRILDRASAEAILVAGQADMVVMGRALIADPELPNKLAAGLDCRVRPCVGCNDGCVEPVRQRKVMGCAVNPFAGHETLGMPALASVSRKIAVVGGGPAGMQAALTAARRGHLVTLYEKSEKLGGLVNAAALPLHKEPYADLVAWFHAELEDAGVRILMNTTPEVETLRCADALLVATGSMPVIPGFCSGVKRLTTAEAVLTGEASAGARVLVIGGGMVGSETAEFMAARGTDVTLLELRPQIAMDMQVRARTFLLESLTKLNVTMLTSAELVRVTPECQVTVKGRFGVEQTLPPFDTLVLATGYRPRTDLCVQLVQAGIPFTAVGDCRQVGNVLAAVQDGFAAGCAV